MTDNEISHIGHKARGVKIDCESTRFEVVGAGFLQVRNNTKSRCGTAVGAVFGVSWGDYGYCGGVMDRKEMIRLRDHLNKLLAE